MTDLLVPWSPIDEERRKAVEMELELELPPDHVLTGKSVRAVAVRSDQDDVLFELLSGGYAVVHLTWSGRRESLPRWPSTELFSSLEEWRELRMIPDHDDFAHG